jgi:hypothetical protein
VPVIFKGKSSAQESPLKIINKRELTGVESRPVFSYVYSILTPSSYAPLQVHGTNIVSYPLH